MTRNPPDRGVEEKEGQKIMCGRYTLAQAADRLAEAFDLDDVPSMPFRYNIAPTQAVPVVRAIGQAPQLDLLHWGLIPSWSKDPTIGFRLINARAETLTEKPSFRAAFRRRRCLIPADGFYEWQQVERKKQPYYFCRDGHQPFAFAGLWEHWESADGEIESCTIVTTEANHLLRSIHHRMPVILQPEDYEQWLDPQVQEGDRLQHLLYPDEDKTFIRYPVSTKVNRPQNDTLQCIEPISLEETDSEVDSAKANDIVQLH
ncbi:SOS response-associated peptidase [Leptolyngbya sp. GB1-A1]|uniref:SOS response-associated peptidase n=1 Tax=Leptolyngbya sp. GB1-A1 TaxID=2933908 RepID=UPI003297E5D4